MNKQISIIVPIYNEEESIKNVIPKLIKFISGINIDYEIITVNDGSKDNSLAELVKNMDGYDLIVGSREKRGNAIPLERRHAKQFLNRFASYLAGKNIPDLNSGLRIFRKDIVFKYWPLFPQRFSFTSTLTMICATRGYETIFVPIDYHKRAGKSSIKAVDFFNFLKWYESRIPSIRRAGKFGMTDGG